MSEKQAVGNTTLGVPEKVFRGAWLALQWKAMARSGRGYPRPRQPTRKEAARDKERQAAEARTKAAAA